MKTSTDNIVTYNPNKSVTDAKALLAEWPDSDIKIFTYDQIDVTNRKQSLPQMLTLKCKLGVALSHEFII